MKTAQTLNVFSCALRGVNCVEASAGTGKTWTLCALYLRVLLQQKRAVQDILVVTFTEAATSELRTRIRMRLQEAHTHLSARVPSKDGFIEQLIASITDESKTESDSKISAREQMALACYQALQCFDEAAIFTIHGFCHRALNDAAFAAGQAFHLDIVSDHNALYEQLALDFWRRHIIGGQPSDLLIAYLQESGDSPRRWAECLRAIAAQPLAIQHWPDATELPTQDALARQKNAALQAWQQAPSPIATLLAAHEKGQLNRNKVRLASLHKGAQQWQYFFDTPGAMAPSIDSFAKLFSTEILEAGKAAGKASPQHDFFVHAQTLLQLSIQAQGLRSDMLQQFCLQSLAQLHARKREQRTLTFDDLLSHLHAALFSPEFPELAQNLRDRFPVALIDEFQDTDPLQYAIFKRIYTQTRVDGDAPLFLVGDPKQAIYRFRGADMHTYLRAKSDADAHYTLIDNQRSSAQLIHACNAFFSANTAAFLQDGLQYYPVQCGAKPRAAFIDNTGYSNTALTLWHFEHQPLRNDAKQQATDTTANEIERLLIGAENALVKVGDRALQPSQIAVLVRSHGQAALIKKALSLRGINSVELSRESVLTQAEAIELECLLRAFAQPTRPGLMLTALATNLCGWQAHQIDALQSNDALLLESLTRFAHYHQLWQQHSIGVALRAWLMEAQVAARLLGQENGERKLTNLLHLFELLQNASTQYQGIDALVLWFCNLRGNNDNAIGDTAQLRLESDRNLVQIVTVHKSKGLEYPIVFCPYFWDAYRKPKSAGEFIRYQESDQQFIDFDSAAIEYYKDTIRAEDDAEDIRLMYVALTRAVHRCYLMTGIYQEGRSRTPTLQSERSWLNWLIAGNGLTPAQWLARESDVQHIESSWRELVQRHGPTLHYCAAPTQRSNAMQTNTVVAKQYRVLTAPPIPRAWSLSSFTRLISHESKAPVADKDEQLLVFPEVTEALLLSESSVNSGSEIIGNTDAAITDADTFNSDDIVFFPRGINAGHCIHSVFEHCDFVDPTTWPVAIEQALQAFPQSFSAPQAGLNEKQLRQKCMRMLHNMLRDVLGTVLPLISPGTIALKTISSNKRLNELGFHLPAEYIGSEQLQKFLHTQGYTVPNLSGQDLRGFLHGFIDLIFEHEGRYYVLDWKSNWLGSSAVDYSQQRIMQAMNEHGYHLQHLLYSVALQRYLSSRLPDYDHAKHFGGVLYLFVRGVRPQWQENAQPCGVYQHRVSETVLNTLDGFFSPANTEVLC